MFAVVATHGMVVIIGYQVYDFARSAYGMSMSEAAFLLGVLGAGQFVHHQSDHPLPGLSRTGSTGAISLRFP